MSELLQYQKRALIAKKKKYTKKDASSDNGKGKQFWSKEDDRKLRKWVLDNNEKPNWNEVSILFPNRTLSQCKARWRLYLKLEHPEQKLSEKDELKLLCLYQEKGADWIAIAKAFPDFNASFIKYTFYQILKRECFEHTQHIRKRVRKFIEPTIRKIQKRIDSKGVDFAIQVDPEDTNGTGIQEEINTKNHEYFQIIKKEEKNEIQAMDCETSTEKDSESKEMKRKLKVAKNTIDTMITTFQQYYPIQICVNNNSNCGNSYFPSLVLNSGNEPKPKNMEGEIKSQSFDVEQDFNLPSPKYTKIDLNFSQKDKEYCFGTMDIFGDSISSPKNFEDNHDPFSFETLFMKSIH